MIWCWIKLCQLWFDQVTSFPNESVFALMYRNANKSVSSKPCIAVWKCCLMFADMERFQISITYGSNIVGSLEITSTRANLRDCINLIISIQDVKDMVDTCAYTCHCVCGYGNKDMWMYAKVFPSECMFLYNTFSSMPLFCCIGSFERSDGRCLCELCISISYFRPVCYLMTFQISRFTFSAYAYHFASYTIK